MRFPVIFLLVLGVSVIVTFFTGWGITFGTSYTRLSMISSDLTSLAADFLAVAGPYANRQLEEDIPLASSILAEGLGSGFSQLEEVNAGAITTIGTLVNYTANVTAQSQSQVSQVLGTLSSLLLSVVTDFKGVASGLAAEVQADAVARASSATLMACTKRGVSLQRFQNLYQLGFFNLSNAPTDPVGVADCTLLGVLCDFATELEPYETMELALTTGRLYTCSTFAGGLVSTIVVNGSLYNEFHSKWLPYDANVSVSAQQSMQQRCLSEKPMVQPVGVNCPWPQSCSCGADPRCSARYRSHVNSSPRLLADDVLVNQDGVPSISFSFPVFNVGNPLVPLGVISSVQFTGIHNFLVQVGLPATTYVATVLNDTNLTVMGSVVKTNCMANETAPGDPALPTWSALRSCDPGLRAVGQWLWHNRSAVRQSDLQANGVLWDISPAANSFFSFFLVVGSEIAVLNGAIDFAENQSLSIFNTFRTGVLQEVASSGVATTAYATAIGAQNLQSAKAALDSFAAEVTVLENRTKVVLAALEAQTNQDVVLWVVNQTGLVLGLRTKHMNAMLTTMDWTLGVVVFVLFVALACSGWGTIHITCSLVQIISLMEDVAEMKVENLEVQRSSVTEVARIQLALQQLIRRLEVYKSYMPAGLFRQEQPEAEESESDKETETEAEETAEETEERLSKTETQNLSTSCHSSNGVPTTNSQPLPSLLLAETSITSNRSVSPTVVSPAHHRTLRRNVAALTINVVGAMEALHGFGDGLTKSLFNDYVSKVHDAVSQGHGNIDCILGDQMFATFNAHIPCSDPVGAAAGAALEVRSQLCAQGTCLRFQMGAAFGCAFASSVGYSKFKSMVTLGSPMKVASLLSHISHFESGAILADVSVEERAKYAYVMRPVELVHLPRLKGFGRTGPASRRVFLIQNKKQLGEDEWLYQLDRDSASADWVQTFHMLVGAASLQEGQQLLQEYLLEHPSDDVALRLRDWLPRWVLGAGVPLHEGPE